MFDLDGTLLANFNNPHSDLSDRFGSAVAAIGADKALIGPYTDDTDGEDTGTAFLFQTDGTLIATIHNPTPASGDHFGFALSDRDRTKRSSERTSTTPWIRAWAQSIYLILRPVIFLV